ncbi:beta-lactamase family protein [Chitinophaga pinensis]|uniref:Beta-lactamase family protein n=1 Tax=Chitinophaga pinensis TaxID=79329 RepID=A0A5C6LLB3_9BACT|nr:beta-lactamase family protein [Chitinophaga pinensis]
MPGLSIAFINNGKVVYHKAIGVTNMDTRTPWTINLFLKPLLSPNLFLPSL